MLGAFAAQVGWCRPTSPFTARLLDRSAAWLATDSAARAALGAVADDPGAAALPLRWAAALHALALRGIEPWAALWPPRPAPDDAALDAALDAAITRAWARQRAAIDAWLARPPQTNEVGRSALLLPGLLHIAARTGLPLALREIGASAGLNLWPERHRYDYGAWSWAGGDEAAALVVPCDWRGTLPAAALAAATLRIADRAACDAAPVDLADPGSALRLASYVWADQRDRLDRVATASALTRRWLADDGVRVQRQCAGDFVAAELGAARRGVATVLLHTIVWPYIAADEQAAIVRSVEAAGARADAGAPLAWLRVEQPAPTAAPELRCRLWPGGDDRLLAQAHPHGSWIDWRA